MYSIDGVPLQNPALGWRLKRTSEPRVSRSSHRADFNAANRDGTISVRGSLATPTVTLTVSSPDANLEPLRLLLRAGASLTRTADPSRVLAVESMTVTPRTVTPAGGGITEVTVVYRCPGVWWRDAAVTEWDTTIPASTSAGSAVMQVLTSSSAPVQDALVVVNGSITNPRVTGANGTWMQYRGAITQVYVRFEAATGRAYAGSSGNEWTDTGNDITGYIDTGAYPYFLELAPSSTAPGCALTVSWDSVTQNTVVSVQARNAYDL